MFLSHSFKNIIASARCTFCYFSFTEANPKHKIRCVNLAATLRGSKMINKKMI